VALDVLVGLSVLERSKEFVSAIIWVFGIFVMLLSRFFLSGATAVPLLWTALWLASSFIILCGALISSGRNFGKIPAKYISVVLAAAGAVLAFIRPFVPFGAAVALTTACTVIKAVSVVALILFIGFAAFRKDDSSSILRAACSALIAVAIAASLFLPQVFPTRYNPMFWMCVATTTVTFISVFIVFMEMKKSNVYLTDNLHREVERQLKDIKAIISERDKLLQFVSHDMRKPLNSSVSLLETAIEREKDSEQIKTLQIIKQNDLRVVSNLSEIAAYAKLNYISEPSQVTDLHELCASICLFHSFDCNANGIILKNLVDKKYKVFVKAKGLESAVSNIIMNAVEHANCSTVTLLVKTVKNKVVLCIADDGNGISADMDVFKPYVSENKPETGGIGLYICKNIIESMNGELTYETGDSGTVFYISLLKA
ncbi:MAG: HAMP domain-containing histidine kinase, partial [Clostridia bacterium]|nr:HAMP domain-containing histidine kinase [Clostridia bacterium]